MSGALDLLRHGDTGQQGYRGQLDDPLSALGWQQLREAVQGHAWDAIVSSPLSRCAAFASELARARDLPLQLDARLMEYHFGAWQGVPMATLAATQGPALARFWVDPAAHPPSGAETLAAFQARLTAALDDITQAHGGRVLVVTHGGAIRLLRCLAEGRPFTQMTELSVPHASLQTLRWPAPMPVP
jgi:alpha-ribazole phosphatase